MFSRKGLNHQITLKIFGMTPIFLKWKLILGWQWFLVYWIKDTTDCIGPKIHFWVVQGVQRVFSLKRYSKMSEYLHVSDRESEKNRGHPEYDKLGKVRWLYDLLNEKFRQYKHPEKEQTIDEMIMPFSSRISHIQYNVSDLDLHLDPPVTLTFTSTLPPPNRPQKQPTHTHLLYHLHHFATGIPNLTLTWRSIEPVLSPHPTTPPTT